MRCLGVSRSSRIARFSRDRERRSDQGRAEVRLPAVEVVVAGGGVRTDAVGELVGDIGTAAASLALDGSASAPNATYDHGRT